MLTTDYAKRTQQPIHAGVLSELFDELFPITRSITGDGLRQSIEVFRRFLPLETVEIDSGTQVFDWTVPPEWRIRRARLTGPDGTVVADLERSNLHVVSYSEPIDVELDLDELAPHLFSLPHLPDAIPYVTSYYKRAWGFCLKDAIRRQLPAGRYHAVIDSELDENGSLTLAHCTLQGESDAEILLSSYLCHPSLANNELSGPLVLLGLYDRLRRWPRRRFTYRFVLNPETIGSLCYLHRFGDQLEAKLEGGLVLTCLGGPEASLSYKRSRNGQSLIDRVATDVSESGAMRMRPFDPRSGSDERQYCSPGFDLPVGQIARTVYGEYDGYHNSLDDKTFMGVDQLVRSIDEIEELLQRVELGGHFMNLSPYGEPQLGRRNLYPNTNSDEMRDHSDDQTVDSRTFLNRALMILSYADGHHDMLDIARRCECSLTDLAPAIERLEAERLLAHVSGRNTT